MKITKQRLRQIIKEETQKFLEGEVINFQQFKQRRHLENETKRFVVLSDKETYSEVEGSYLLFVQPDKLPEQWIETYNDNEFGNFVKALKEEQEIPGASIVSIGGMFNQPEDEGE